MKNLARNWTENSVEIFEEVDVQVARELTEAGISFEGYESMRQGEVPTKHIGSMCMWSFRRAWYYYVVEGPGIPPDVAEQFHVTWGKEVRVAGHCACPSPLEWHEGFAVGMYHIDTQEGLNAFAKLLKSVHKPKKETP